MKEIICKKIRKEAGVLLLAIITVLSTVAVTANNQSPELIRAVAEEDLWLQPTNMFDPDWIHFDDGVNYAGIGATSGLIWEGAIRITPDELEDYDGWTLTTIRWFHFVQSGNPQHSGNIKIYEGGTSTWPGALITTESYTIVGHGWKEKILSHPVTLNATEDIWISIETTTQVSGEYPLGIDFTFAVDGKGDWIYSNGEWRELQNLSSGGPGTLDYNWNIWAGVEEFPSGSNPPEPPERPEGQAEGFVGVNYLYITRTTDPEGDQISYLWNWGDGTPLEWTGFYNSGMTASAEHNWTEAGSYNIRVKAKDLHEEESDWSEPKTIHIVEKPVLEIGDINSGLIKVTVAIRNSGGVAATRVNWSITFVGGFILSGAASGMIVNIPAGGGKTISSGLIFGLGKTMVIVRVEKQGVSSAVKEQEASVFLFFIKM